MEKDFTEDEISNFMKEKSEFEEKANVTLKKLAAAEEKEALLTEQLNESKERLVEMEEILQAMNSEIERSNTLRQQEAAQFNQIILSLQHRLAKSQRNYEFCNNNFIEVNFVRKYNKKKNISLEAEVKELNKKIRCLKEKNSKLRKKNEVLSVESALVQDANNDLTEKLHTSRITISSLKNTKTMLMEKIDSFSLPLKVEPGSVS